MANLNPDIEAAQIEWRNHRHDGDTKHDVHRALGELPAVNRRVILLRFFEGMSFKEVGEEMSITPAKARALYYESAIALRKALSRPPALRKLALSRLDKGRKKE